MPSPAIETHNLCKIFNGDKVAVADLSLTVERGEVFGFLGPNGVGKTTSVKILLGLISATSGKGTLLDAPIGEHRTRSKVGFLPEHFRFHEWLTAKEFLTLHADLYSMDRRLTQKRVPELLERVDLTPHADKKLRAFSKGMLQRIGLAQSLLNQPELVFLDEPTSGLDPVGRRMVRDIIKDLRQQGTTVFLNSHFLSEVEVTCDRVAFIKNGKVVRTARMDALVDGELAVQIRVRNMGQRTIDGLSEWANNMRLDGDHLSLTVASEALLPQITQYLVEQGAEVYAIRPQQMSLEELFLQIVGDENG
jgi:ABC-2 type transport system ATP-binding protein